MSYEDAPICKRFVHIDIWAKAFKSWYFLLRERLLPVVLN